jgi:hypothetical protein
MGKLTLFEIFKEIIEGISWRIFLWASNMTEEEYIYRIVQENQNNHK